MTWRCFFGLLHDWQPLVLDLNYGTREEVCRECQKIQIEYRDGTVLDVTDVRLSDRMRLTKTYGAWAPELLVEMRLRPLEDEKHEG